jgi:guanylate kinase
MATGMSLALVLVGPPTSGKDTITTALSTLDGRYALFKKLKVGPGRQDGYRMTDAQTLDALIASGEIALLTSRYSSRYAVDYPELLRLAQAGQTPVIHIGNVNDVQLLRSDPRIGTLMTVLLTLPRDIAIQRIRERATADDELRIAAYDEDVARLRDHGDAIAFDLVVDTGECGPAAAAELINQQVQLFDNVAKM